MKIWLVIDRAGIGSSSPHTHGTFVLSVVHVVVETNERRLGGAGCGCPSRQRSGDARDVRAGKGGEERLEKRMSQIHVVEL